MPNQLDLTSGELARINSKIGSVGTTAQFAEAYREILRIDDEHKAVGEAGLDDRTRFFLSGAANVNDNNAVNSANVFIRSLTQFGLQWDGKDTSGSQNTSNAIGAALIDDINLKSGVPPLDTFAPNDISTAILSGGQTVAGWGGAFYFWDLPWAEGKSVGQTILADPGENIRGTSANQRTKRGP